ncbi:MAG: radical SAM protein [Planctomycetota bacterium]
MKIALLQPPPLRIRQSHDVNAYPSLALGYLAGYLERAGFTDLLIVDGRMENIPLDEAVRDIVDFEPDLLGITAKTHEIGQAARAAQEVKARLPRVTTVVGGCHVTAEPEATLRHYPALDYGLAGEGELSLHEMCLALAQGLSLESIPGLVYRRDGQVLRNAPRPFLEDLDSLPFPAWHLFRKRRKSYMIFGSRGCPYDCAFCMRVLGRKPRLRSPANILAEIDRLVQEFGIRAFDFEDETFGLRRDHALTICQGLVERGFHERLVWTANLRANLVDEELLRALKGAGCARVAIGVESGDPAILQAIGKGITLPQVEEAFRLARKAGLETAALFILGHPNETRETALRTVRLATRLNPTSLSVGIMVPYPGTRVREMALRGEGGYRLLSDRWEDYDKYLGNALALQGLSRRRLELLQAWAYVRFYLWNLRFRDLVAFLARHAREAFLLLRKIFMP